ncbi:S14 domain and spectrin repeat-containing protein 1 [Mactra antiquata]
MAYSMREMSYPPREPSYPSRQPSYPMNREPSYPQPMEPSYNPSRDQSHPQYRDQQYPQSRESSYSQDSQTLPREAPYQQTREAPYQARDASFQQQYAEQPYPQSRDVSYQQSSKAPYQQSREAPYQQSREQPQLRDPSYPPQPRDTNYSQSGNIYPSPNPSRRSHRSEMSQSQRSLNSRQSMRSTNGMPMMESRNLEASHILDQLQKEIVFLTGGRDRQGGPLLIFPPHRDEYFQPNDITSCVKYLYQIPSEESKRRGFTAIIDSRDGSWSNLVTVLGCLKQSLGDYLKQVLVLRTDGMRVKQANSSSFRRDQGPNIEPQFINLNRLYTFVDQNQLIGSMGGSLMYHHAYWLQNRLDLEKFLREARAVATHLDTSESEISHQLRNQNPDSPMSPVEALRQHRFFQDSILSVPKQILNQGQDLLQKLQQYSDMPVKDEEAVTTLDNLEAQKHVKRMLQYIENRVDKIRNYLDNRDRSLHVDVQRDTVQREIRQVVDWILGPGEKLLASQSDIGDSYETADTLRKRHEELEIKCTDTYGHYAELRHRAEDLLEDSQSSITDDIRAQRDYMDTVCRSFASRLERRRTLLITSVRFHRLTSEFEKKLDDLLELLYNDKEADTVEAAKNALTQLQEKVDAIDLAAGRAMSDGHSLLDEMSRPIKNAFGKDISPDYANQMKHVNQRLEELQMRKMRCDDLAEVRKLKLQQILQLRTCELDAQQAISWIQELYDVMLTSQTNIGQTPQEIDNLQEEHRQVETTAGGTYNYGKQLLQAALVLRRSLRLELEPNGILSHELEEAWKRFSMGNNERANRLSVASKFLDQSDKQLVRVEQLMVVVAQTLTGDVSVRDALVQNDPEKIDVEREIHDTSRMGKALLERLALPVLVIDG